MTAIERRQIFAAVVQDERAGRRRTLTLADRRIIIARVARVSCEAHYDGKDLRVATERSEQALRAYGDRTLTFLAAQMRVTSVGFEYMGAVAAAHPEGFVHALRALDDSEFALPLPMLLHGAAHDHVLAPRIAAARAPHPADPAIAALRGAFTVISAIHEGVPSERSRGTASLLDHHRAGDGGDSICLANSDLAKLVASRPGDARRIGEIVVERRTDDPTAIAAVLDSVAPALRSGAL